MKKRLLPGLIVIVLLDVAGWTSYGQRNSQPRASYEYQVIYDPTETGSASEGIKKLNELGAQGWELVGVNHEGNIVTTKLYFRRIKQ